MLGAACPEFIEGPLGDPWADQGGLAGIKGGPKVRREEGRLKAVTPLAIFLWELTGARSRSGFSGLPVWRRRKGV